MQLLISDANILIDMDHGGLSAKMFHLPYQFCLPDILFYEELDEEHHHLLEHDLRLSELDGDTMMEAMALVNRYAKPSRNDCFALALAKLQGCSLLTGDRSLKNAARREGVEVRGSLWLVEELVLHKVISTDQASEAYKIMRTKGRRLPWDLAHERLGQLQVKGSLAQVE